MGYLIEFRFQGRQGKEIKKEIANINRRFKISLKNRVVPHITLVAPFNTRYQKRLVNDFRKICKNRGHMKFKLKGYDSFRHAGVVYINIEPSKKMSDLRNDFVNKLKSYCNLCDTDVFNLLLFKIAKKYSPHVTLALKLGPQKFERVLGYVNRNKHPYNKNYILARATLMKDRKILYEYDFILNKMLSRRQAKSRKAYSKTIRGLKKDSDICYSIWREYH